MASALRLRGPRSGRNGLEGNSRSYFLFSFAVPIIAASRGT
jgi:hypothetical protein